jgi:hypothetical protein
LVALFVLRGIMLASILPPFEGWDEYQHVGYVDHVATAHSPAIFGETTLDPEYVRAVAQFPEPIGMLPAEFNARTYADYWNQPPPSSGAATRIQLYQAQHPVTYYWLVSPIYKWCCGRSDLRLSVSILRLINLLFGAGALVMVLLWIRWNLPAQAGLAAALWIAFQPLLLLNVMRVANDALAYFLGTAVIVISMSFRNKRIWVQCFLLAVLLPFAVLTKLNNLALVPWVFLVLILRTAIGEVRPLAAFSAIVLVLLAFVLATWHYFSFNLNHFGILTPMQEAVSNHQAGRRFFDIVRAPPLKFWLLWSWGWWVANAMWVGGWSFLRLPLVFSRIYELIVVVAGITLLRRAKYAMKPAHLLGILSLLIFVEAAMLYHALQAYSALSGKVTTNPWYTAVAAPWWLILLASGAAALPWRRWRIALIVAFPLVCVLGEAYGLIFRMIPFYSAAPNYPEALRRLATLHPSILGTTPLAISALLSILILSMSILLSINHKTSVARG